MVTVSWSCTLFILSCFLINIAFTHRTSRSSEKAEVPVSRMQKQREKTGQSGIKMERHQENHSVRNLLGYLIRHY